MTVQLDFLVVIGVILLLLFILRWDARKFAKSQDITEITSKDGSNIYIASKADDQKKPGAKIILILHSVVCRSCGSTHVFVDFDKDTESLTVKCRDCKYVTQIPLQEIVI